MSATLEKLRNLAASPAETVHSGDASGAQATMDDRASLIDQIEAFYEEKEYLNKNFPGKGIKEVVDLAVSLRKQAAEGAQVGESKPLGFVPGEVLAAASELDAATADALGFGVVEVDDHGVVKMYNRYESELAGVSPEQAMGKNFFLEVAPCTNNRLFLGRFRQGVETGALTAAFNYTFTYKMKPTNVAIAMFRCPVSARNFVFVQRR